MAHVAEHHGEKEGEGDDGVGCCGNRAMQSVGPPKVALNPGSGTALNSNFKTVWPMACCLQPPTIVHLPDAALSLHCESHFTSEKTETRRS